ncbi:MAG: prepilin-type N-terminal cleavage/methylation domain-containing protein [Methylophilaceae bacterium]|nr:prepilin-type N-terminal cleavage/methylation domain-containing protein [Methylophilaceae bacterium]
MQLNIQSSFGRARGLLRRLICRGLPERLCITSSVGFFNISAFKNRLVIKFHSRCSSFVSKASSYATPSVRKAASGFTLVELLVVVTLLGILAIGIVVSLDGVEDDAKERLTKAEMSELRKALLQFRRDVGHFPDAEGFYDPPVSDPIADAEAREQKLRLLLKCQPDDTLDNFDEGCVGYVIDSGRGWNGPYVLAERLNDVIGLYDPWDSHYQLFEPASASPGNGFARLVSAGPNKLYDGDHEADKCLPKGDDIVLCLVQ